MKVQQMVCTWEGKLGWESSSSSSELSLLLLWCVSRRRLAWSGAWHVPVLFKWVSVTIMTHSCWKCLLWCFCRILPRAFISLGNKWSDISWALWNRVAANVSSLLLSVTKVKHFFGICVAAKRHKMYSVLNESSLSTQYHTERLIIKGVVHSKLIVHPFSTHHFFQALVTFSNPCNSCGLSGRGKKHPTEWTTVVSTDSNNRRKA